MTLDFSCEADAFLELGLIASGGALHTAMSPRRWFALLGEPRTEVSMLPLESKTRGTQDSAFSRCCECAELVNFYFWLLSRNRLSAFRNYTHCGIMKEPHNISGISFLCNDIRATQIDEPLSLFPY